jgi:threonine aldolase
LFAGRVHGVVISCDGARLWQMAVDKAATATATASKWQSCRVLYCGEGQGQGHIRNTEL